MIKQSLLKTFILISILYSITSRQVIAQDLWLDYAYSLGSIYDDKATSITCRTDLLGTHHGSGWLHVVGSFQGSVDFDPYEEEVILSSESSKVFLKKDFDWTIPLPSAISDNYSLVMDDSLNLIVFGRTLDSTGIIISKINPDGVELWSLNLVTPMADVVLSYSLEVNSSNDILVAGTYSGALMIIGPTGFSWISASSSGNNTGYLIKINPAGGIEWAKKIMLGVTGTTFHDVSLRIQQESFPETETLVVAGSFSGNDADFDPGPSVSTLSSPVLSSLFLQKLDMEGEYISAKLIAQSSETGSLSIASTRESDLSGVIAGEFRNTLAIDNGGETLNLVSNGGTDVFVIYLDDEGELKWAKSFGSSLDDYVSALSPTYASKEFLLTGAIADTTRLENELEELILVPKGGTDAYIIKMDGNDGAYLMGKTIGGQGNDFGYAIHYGFYHFWDGIFRSIFVAGSFELVADLDPGMDVYPVYSAGGADVFVAKYREIASLGIDEPEDLSPLVFPNPTLDHAFIDLGTLRNVTIRVYSMNGVQVSEWKDVFGTSFKIPLDAGPGLYFIQVLGEDQQYVFKIIRL